MCIRGSACASFFSFLLLLLPCSNFFSFFPSSFLFFLFFFVYLPGPLPSPIHHRVVIPCVPSPLSPLSMPPLPSSFFPFIFLSASLSLSLCPPHVRPSHSSLPSFSSFSLRAFLVVSLARVCVSFARRDAYCEYYSPLDVAHVRSSPPSTLLRFINPEGRSRDIDIAAHDRGPIRWTPSLRASLRSFSPIFIPIV